MKVHLGNEQKAFLGDFGSSSNEVSKLLVNSTEVVHSEGNKFGTVISCVLLVFLMLAACNPLPALSGSCVSESR